MIEQLHRLLAAWRSDDLSESDADELLAALRADPELRAAFAAEISLYGMLRAVQSGQPRWLKLEKLLAGMEDVLLPPTSLEDGVMARVGTSVAAGRATTPSRRSLSVWLLSRRSAWSVASLLLLTLAGLLWFRPTETILRQAVVSEKDPGETLGVARGPAGPDDAIAVVSEVIDGAEENVRETRFQKNQLLAQGWYEVAAGTVQLDFLSGVQMIVRAPARFELRSASEVYFDRGRCTCTVSEMGLGFKVLSARMEVLDLGTVFSFSVDPDEDDEVHVIDGKVEVRTPQQVEPREVRASDAVGVRGAVLVSVPFRPADFPHADELVAQRRSQQEAAYQDWRRGAARLANDTDTLVYFTFDELRAGSAVVVNRATAANRGTDGVMMGCRTVEGRWPGKQAVKFDHEPDRILFRLEGQQEKLTFMAWVRVNALVNRGTALLMSESYRRWAQLAQLADEEQRAAHDRLSAHGNKTTRWIIDREGRPSLHLEFLRKQADTLWEAYCSEDPVVQYDTWGSWSQLALTYDGRTGTLTHYMNGKPVSTQALHQLRPLSLEFCEIGNLYLNSKERAGGIDYRYFGEIDEFLVSRRAMTPEEIQQLWGWGRP